MEWLWMYAAGLFWPMTALGVPVAAIAIYLFNKNRERNKGLNWGDPKYQDIAHSNWTIANIVGLYGVLWMLVAAVPDPEYNVRIVEKPVIQKVVETEYVDRWRGGVQKVLVYKTPTYESAYGQCIALADKYRNADIADVERCHGIAAQVSLPPMRKITQTRTITRTIRAKPQTYSAVYDGCVNKLLIDGPDNAQKVSWRMERAKLCHAQAIAVTR